MPSKAAKLAGLCEGSAPARVTHVSLQFDKRRKTLVASIDLGRRRLPISRGADFQSDQKSFWRPADTFGLAAGKTFVKSPKQERRVNRLDHGGAGVPGYNGATEKTAACAGMTL